MTKKFECPCWQKVDLDDPERHTTWVCGYHGERFDSIKEWDAHVEERSHERYNEEEKEKQQ